MEEQKRRDSSDSLTGLSDRSLSAQIYKETTNQTTFNPRRQYLAASAANLASLAAGCVLAWTSPVLPKLEEKDFYLYASQDQRSWIGSLVALGAAIGPFPAGIMADRLGRKKAILSLGVPFFVGWLLITTASSVGVIYLARIVLGFATGALFAVVPMYIGEIAEDRVRGALGSLMQLFITFGFLFEYCIGPYVSYVTIGVLSSIVPIVFFAVFYLVPDSPYHLLSQHKIEEAEQALQWLRQAPMDVVRGEMDDMLEAIEEDRRNKGSIKDLFISKGNLKALYLSLGLVAGQQVSGINVVIFYSEDIFSKTGSGLSASASTIIVGVVIMLASFVTPLMADRLGRRLLLLVSAVGMGISQAVLGFFFYVESKGGPEAVVNISWLPVMSVVVYIIVYAIGFGPLPWAVMGELFPPNVKGIASSITASFCWLLAFFLTKFFSNIVDALGTHVAFWIFAVCCIFNTVFVFILLPETKGKSLAEIQDILNGRPLRS